MCPDLYRQRHVKQKVNQEKRTGGPLKLKRAREPEKH